MYIIVAFRTQTQTHPLHRLDLTHWNLKSHTHTREHARHSSKIQNSQQMCDFGEINRNFRYICFLSFLPQHNCCVFDKKTHSHSAYRWWTQFKNHTNYKNEHTNAPSRPTTHGRAAIGAFFSELVPRLGCLAAAIIMHKYILVGCMHAPLLFYDTTPTGRILSRFSKDVDVLDTTLPMELCDTIYCMFEVRRKCWELLRRTVLNVFDKLSKWWLREKERERLRDSFHTV